MLRLLLKLIEGVVRLITTPLTQKPETLEGRIVAAMKRKGYRLDTHNIVYIINYSGSEPNRYNDLRAIVTINARYDEKLAKLAASWPCTTEPGDYYVEHRINNGGAAYIAPGQYKAWQVGSHRGNHEALIQTGGVVTVTRDDNEDFSRDGDKRYTGWFGINQHGPGSSSEYVGRNSAGCLVARSMEEHREFMKLVKTFPGYLANNRFVFTATILTAKDIA